MPTEGTKEESPTSPTKTIMLLQAECAYTAAPLSDGRESAWNLPLNPPGNDETLCWQIQFADELIKVIIDQCVSPWVPWTHLPNHLVRLGH
jgi:hypothetical protein